MHDPKNGLITGGTTSRLTYCWLFHPLMGIELQRLEAHPQPACAAASSNSNSSSSSRFQDFEEWVETLISLADHESKPSDYEVGNLRHSLSQKWGTAFPKDAADAKLQLEELSKKYSAVKQSITAQEVAEAKQKREAFRQKLLLSRESRPGIQSAGALFTYSVGSAATSSYVATGVLDF
jgi:hypothetical protein